MTAIMSNILQATGKGKILDIKTLKSFETVSELQILYTRAVPCMFSCILGLSKKVSHYANHKLDLPIYVHNLVPYGEFHMLTENIVSL